MRINQAMTKVQRKSIFLFGVFAFAGGLVSCSHEPVIAEAKNVKVAREKPSSSCEEIGLVTGKTASDKETVVDAIEDMKLDAAKRGANFVRMQSTGAMGTSVSGTAYHCE